MSGTLRALAANMVDALYAKVGNLSPVAQTQALKALGFNLRDI